MKGRARHAPLLLWERKATDILLALYDRPMHIRALRAKVGGSFSTIKDRVEKLIQLGLIEESTDERRPLRILRLTDQGRKIAAVLKSIYDLYTPGGEKLGETNDRKKWILVLAYVVGGRIKGNTRLVKLLFLLREKFGVVGPDFYEFRPYLFGPFSPDVLEDAKALCEAGLLELEEEVFEAPEISDFPIVRKSYELTDKGWKEAIRIYQALPSNVKKALQELRKFHDMPLDMLLRFIYMEFPHYALYKRAEEIERLIWPE